MSRGRRRNYRGGRKKMGVGWGDGGVVGGRTYACLNVSQVCARGSPHPWFPLSVTSGSQGT